MSSAALVSFWLGLQRLATAGSGSGSGCTNWLCLHSTRMKICVANKVEPDGKLICFTTMDQPASKPVSQPASQPELGMPCRPSQAVRQSSQVESSRAGPGTQTRNQLLFGRTLVLRPHVAHLMPPPPTPLLLPSHDRPSAR